METFAKAKIEAYVGPQELGAADNLEQVIVDFIGEAEDSLAIAVQELDSLPIAQAILDAAWRGVSVRMVVEQDYLQDKKPPLDDPNPGESDDQARWRAQWSEDPPRGLDMNRAILIALLRSGVHVTADYNPVIFHQKFVIRDYRTKALPTSGLLTGSANFTNTDCHTNLNHLVVFHDYRICREYRREFGLIEKGDFGRSAHGPVPETINVEGVPVKVLFAPDHTPELEIMKQINKCEGSLNFAIFTFSGSSGIDDSMIMLRRAEFEVRGVMDPGQAAQDWAPTKRLHEAGVALFLPRREKPFGKLHHKLMVIDEAIVVAGSFNYTAPANDYNDENIFVLGSPEADLGDDGGVVDAAECAALANFFRAEIERMVTDLSDPYAP